jgi:hypothetical protein
MERGRGPGCGGSRRERGGGRGGGLADVRATRSGCPGIRPARRAVVAPRYHAKWRQGRRVGVGVRHGGPTVVSVVLGQPEMNNVISD